MRYHHATIRIAAVVLSLGWSLAQADIDAGIAAYRNRDYLRAHAEFLDAAKRNDPLAMNVLGIMYAEGLGIAPDDRAAVDWFFKGQALGSLEAGANLARMFAEGRGVRQSNREALRLYREAALAGYLPAMKRLAEIYEAGELGIAADPQAAKEWRARLGGTPTGLMYLRPTPAETPAAAELPRASAKAERPPPMPKPVAPTPARHETPLNAPGKAAAEFEKQVLAQLEQYGRRERKLQVSSSDSTPGLVGYLTELRARVGSQLKDAFPRTKPHPSLILSISIARDGVVRQVETEHGSGNPAADRRVVSAVKGIARLAPLPRAALDLADVLVVTVRVPIE